VATPAACNDTDDIQLSGSQRLLRRCAPRNDEPAPRNDEPTSVSLFLPMKFWLALLIVGNIANASPLIYKPDAIGSDSTFNPLSYYLNLAFDTTQNPNYFSQSRFFANHGVLWDRVKNPIRQINDSGGFGHFVQNEIIGLNAVPNYTLHLFGGGYDYRWLAEWYEAHNIPLPYLVAFLNAYLADIGNEALESSAVQITATDPIADLFLFDLAGKLLFLNDGVVRFMHDSLKMRAWHSQPMFNLLQTRIDNAGANYIFRPEIFGEKIRPFVHIGMALMVGASFQMDGGNSLTPALGLALSDPLAIKGDLIGGLYWDREDSLLASLTINGTSKLAFRLNLYPDFVSVGDLRMGYYLAYAKSGEAAVGVNLILPAGVSASF